MPDPVSEAHAQWVSHGWSSAADGMATVLELVRTHRILTDRIERTLSPLDLSFARYEILMLLSFTKRGALSIGGLGRLLQVHSTSITSTVDLLENRGLAQRLRGAPDRRMVLVQITPDGRRVAAAATETLNAEVFTALGLTSSQGTLLWALLRAFRANAGDFYAVSGRTRGTG